MTEPAAHFGFREVPAADKADMVREVFDSVADKYDVMNDLMSLGAHRLWKNFTVAVSGVRRGDDVLDVAAGSGDLAARFAERVGAQGSVTVSDINSAMLCRGRGRLADRGFAGNLRYVQADAENLPFAPDFFDCASIGFGLRNVTRPQAALASMCRCVRPGGRVIVLEFSKPGGKLLKSLYDAYSFGVLPKLGKWVAEDEASYRYLVESIRRQPPQEELKRMMCDAGLERVAYHNLGGGIVAVHIGYKL